MAGLNRDIGVRKRQRGLHFLAKSKTMIMPLDT